MNVETYVPVENPLAHASSQVAVAPRAIAVRLAANSKEVVVDIAQGIPLRLTVVGRSIGRSSGRSPRIVEFLRAARSRVLPLELAGQKTSVPDAERIGLEPLQTTDGLGLVRSRICRPRRVVAGSASLQCRVPGAFGHGTP